MRKDGRRVARTSGGMLGAGEEGRRSEGSEGVRRSQMGEELVV